ncbi:MAG TPA: TIGR01841 family phasin [Noviherbaspirillum sp.]
MTRLSDLNMRILRETADASAALSRRLVDTRNPQEYLATATEQTQRHVERLTMYGQHVNHIVRDVRAEFGKVVQEELASMTDQASAAMNKPFGQAADSAGPFGEWVKAARAAASAGVEHLLGAVAQMNQVSDQTPPMPEKPTSLARRK